MNKKIILSKPIGKPVLKQVKPNTTDDATKIIGNLKQINHIKNIDPDLANLSK